MNSMTKKYILIFGISCLTKKRIKNFGVTILVI